MINFVNFNSVVEAIRNDAMLECEMTVEPLEGNTITINNDDLVSKTFSLDRYCQSSDALEVGSACAAELSFSLLNHSGKFNGFKFEGAKIDLKIIDPTDNSKKIQIGKFIVDVKPKQANTISIVALDCMVVMDKEIDWDNFVWHQTATGLIEEICADCNITLSDGATERGYTDGINYLYSKPIEEKMTYRQLLQQILELTCRNAFIDENGELDFAWYKDMKPNIGIQIENRAEGFKITSSDRFQSSIEETDLIPRTWIINSVDEKGDDTQNNVVLNENGDFDFISEGNVLLEYNPIPSLDSLYNFTKLCWRSGAMILEKARKFSAQTLPFFFLMPMDEVVFVTQDGEEISTTITHTNFKLNGGMKIECKLPTLDNSGYASMGAMTARERQLLSQIRKKANQNATDSEMINKITERENALISYNKAANNGVYLNKTEHNGQVYYHNGDTLEESAHIMIFNDEGVGWTNQGGWDSSKEDPVVFEYFIRSDGTTALSDIFAYKINADFLSVKDLSALSANIGGWVIGNSMLYTQSSVQQIEGADTSGYVVFKNSYSLLDPYVLTIGSSSLQNLDDARFAVSLDGTTRIGVAEGLHTKIYPEGIGIGEHIAASAYTEKHFALIYDKDVEKIIVKVSNSNGLEMRMDDSATKRFELKSNGQLYAKQFISNYIDNGATNQFAGFTHYRNIENTGTYNSSFGVGVSSSKPTVAFELKDTSGNILSRLDFRESTNTDYYTDLFMQGKSTGTSAVLSFNGDEIGSSKAFSAAQFKVKYTNNDSQYNSAFAQVSSGDFHLGINALPLRFHATSMIIPNIKIKFDEQLGVVTNGGYSGFTFGVINTDWMSTTEYWTSVISAGQEVLTLAASVGIVLDSPLIYAQKGSWIEVDVSSTENIKTNINVTDTVLGLFSEERSRIYNYNLIKQKESAETSSDEFGTMSVPEEIVEVEENVSYGFVIGDGYAVPSEVLSEDGKHINLYSMASINWKATQELYEELIDAKARISELENQLSGG